MSNPLNSLMYGWHVRRAIAKIIRRLRDDVVRQGTSKAFRYANVKIDLKFFKNGKMGFRLSGDPVAAVIESGFKSYNWGSRVLKNNKRGKNKIDRYGQPYRIVAIKDKLLGKMDFRAVSQRSINRSGNRLWRMPSRKGEGLMRKEFIKQKEAIKSEIIMATLRDRNLDYRRRK